MLRVLFWGIIYILFFGCINIKIKYKDGLFIHYKSWLKKLNN